MDQKQLSNEKENTDKTNDDQRNFFLNFTPNNPSFLSQAGSFNNPAYSFNSISKQQSVNRSVNEMEKSIGSPNVNVQILLSPYNDNGGKIVEKVNHYKNIIIPDCLHEGPMMFAVQNYHQCFIFKFNPLRDGVNLIQAVTEFHGISKWNFSHSKVNHPSDFSTQPLTKPSITNPYYNDKSPMKNDNNKRLASYNESPDDKEINVTMKKQKLKYVLRNHIHEGHNKKSYIFEIRAEHQKATIQILPLSNEKVSINVTTEFDSCNNWIFQRIMEPDDSILFNEKVDDKIFLMDKKPDKKEK
jgi:hypothetical protein